MEEVKTVTQEDCLTLIGHAAYLRLVRGENDMPSYFFGLAERIAILIGDEELARRVVEVRDGGK